MVRGAAASIGPAFLEEPAVAAALREARVLYATTFVLSTPQRAAIANAMVTMIFY